MRSKMQRPCLLLAVLLLSLAAVALATGTSQQGSYEGYTVHLVFSNHLVSGRRDTYENLRPHVRTRSLSTRSILC
jgi:hypothetical protein